MSPLSNADLFLDVNVWFCRIEPPDIVTDTNGVQQTVLSWGSDATWLDWVNRCVRIIERRLDGKFWLVPDRAWGVKYALGAGYYVPNIKCGLRIHPVSLRDRYHLQLNCYRVPPSFCPRTASAVASSAVYGSYMQTGGGQPGYGRIVNTDAWSCRTHDTEAHYQEVAVHEFGHFLGLDHVGVGSPQCPANGNTNQQACYGLTVRQRGDALGFGNRIEGWHVFPWANRLQRHVGRSVQWKMRMSWPAPTFHQTGDAVPLFDFARP